MATSNQSSPVSQLIDIDEQLTGQRELLKNLTQQANAYSDSVKETLRNYTDMNNSIRSAALEIAKLKSGKESLTKAENLLTDLAGQQITIASRLNSITATMTAREISRLDNAKTYQETLEDTQKKLLESVETQKQYTQGSVDYLRIEQDILRYKQDINTTTTNLTALLRNEKVARSFILFQQEKELENSKKITQQYIDQTKASRSAFGKDWFTSLAEKILPRSLNMHKGMSAEIAKHGKLAGGVLIGFTLIAAAVEQIVKAMFRADQDATDLGRNMGIVKDEAFDVLNYFEGVSNQIKEGLYSSRDVLKAQLAINNALGTAMILRSEDLQTTVKMMEMMGITEESMGQIAKFASVSGKSFKDVKNEILGSSKIAQIQNGVFLNDKNILEEVLKTTGSIRANFKGSTKEMAAAVVQAKMLGTTLDGVQKTSEFLLDFEQSIQAEMKAELLTGKQLNLERMRSAALVGDMSTVMSEMAKQGGSLEEVLKMNVIQQNALAESFGMSRDEYTDMLFEQTALNRLRTAGLLDEQKSVIENFTRLKAEGKDVAKLLGEEVAKRYETQSAQERLNKIFEKFQVILERLVQNGVLDKLMVSLANIATRLSEGGLASALLGFGEDKYTAADFGMQTVNDSVISPSGNIKISTPKGMIVPNREDSIITTTNPNGLLAKNAGSSMLEAKLDTMISLLRKDKDLYMDSIKVGTSQAMSNHNYA